ncbi:hypothetical protein L6164_018463 [Bauhinia variegata]|uniref:Uncharacterized protein n=1 Tax=Bauhinia variegata TaxID=167791 RepID=A0ACB9NBB0_BAUVA|nr:hypothetical protein L6164_018463 [Bauhinia variegata]
MASTIFSTILGKSLRFSENLLLARSYCSARRFINRRNLYSRISPLGDPSISLIPVLDRWVEEGNAVKATELQHIVKDLRGSKRFKQALEVSEWMSSKKLCPFSPGDQAVQLELIGRVRGLDFAESYFQNLIDEDKTDKRYGAMLNCYVREGLIDKSLSYMQKIKDMGFASALNYNNIMCLYTHTDQFEKVPGVLSQMKEDGISPDIFSYRICISSYGARSDLENMEKVLEEMEKQSHVSTDWMTYSMVASYYIKAGLKEKALIHLKKCEDKVDKNALGYNHLISHYASLGNKKAMMRLWNLQKAKCKKQLNRDYITILGCLLKLEELEEMEKLIEEWESSANYYDFRVTNILLIGYTRKGLMETAEKVLRSIVKKGKTPTPNSWVIIAYGYLEKQNMAQAFLCLKEALAVRAENKGWKPKSDGFSTVLSWAADNRDLDEVVDFADSLKTVIPLNRDMYLSLIKMYVRRGKEVDGLLENMKDDKIEVDEEIEKILGSRQE